MYYLCVIKDTDYIGVCPVYSFSTLNQVLVNFRFGTVPVRKTVTFSFRAVSTASQPHSVSVQLCAVSDYVRTITSAHARAMQCSTRTYVIWAMPTSYIIFLSSPTCKSTFVQHNYPLSPKIIRSHHRLKTVFAKVLILQLTP